MTSAAARLARVVARLFCRDGGPFAGQAALHEPAILWTIQRGQYVMIVDPITGSLFGFLGWWRMTAATAAQIRTHGAESLLASSAAAALDDGPIVHAAYTTVSPWAPPITYRALIHLAKRANRDASRWTAFLTKRDGRHYWHERRMAA